MSQPRSLEGKLAIVTGGSRGIGAAVCKNLASKGCNLVINYTSASSEYRTVDLATTLSKAHNVKAVPCRADLGSPTDPARLVAFALEQFPNAKLDIVINNAGISNNCRLAEGSAEEFLADYQRQYAVNVQGPMLLMHAARPHLPADRSGRVVNVSSVSSSIGLAGQTVYGGTKAALEAMTRTWSRELRENATVNAINPGPVATDMFGGVADWFAEGLRPWSEVAPLAQVREGVDNPEMVEAVRSGGAYGKGSGGRPATAAEIAGVIGMLCSPEAGWCTGSVVCANGGMRFSP